MCEWDAGRQTGIPWNCVLILYSSTYIVIDQGILGLIDPRPKQERHGGSRGYHGHTHGTIVEDEATHTKGSWHDLSRVRMQGRLRNPPGLPQYLIHTSIVDIFRCGLHQGLGLPDFPSRTTSKDHRPTACDTSNRKIGLDCSVGHCRKREAHASSVVFHSFCTVAEMVASAAVAARKVAPIGMDKSVLLTALVDVEVSKATLVGVGQYSTSIYEPQWYH